MSTNSLAKDIFLAAIEILRQDQRDAFVTGACRGDDALYHEVQALLEAHFEKDSWLDPDALRRHLDGDTQTARLELPESVKEMKVGSQIGNYKLLEQIGAGGMGIVFMAEQLKPIRRKVALKIIKPGMDTSQVVARFEAERQALALMDHPNIAHVLDAGTTDSGRPYFVMELVRGIPITEYCDKNRLNTRERLKLFTKVCQAVQHAHNKGIIHRDIKPSNVLVTLHDGVPVPKIIDFGVAKATNQQLTDRTLFTSFAQFVGTPLYMSPEQAEMSGLDVDTRSDVYSLGVLLYELLTGTTPFDRVRLHQAALDEVRRIIREEEPPRPSTRVSTLGEESKSCTLQRSTDPIKLKQLLQRELDWIVMKTLEKDRTRRYETVSQLAIEVQRYLDGQPVEACPPTTFYQLSKFASRHRTAVWFATCLMAIVLGSSVLLWTLYSQAKRARDVAVLAQAEAQRDRDRALDAEQAASAHLKRATQEKERADTHATELKQRLYDFNIIKANAAYRDRDPMLTSRLLEECLPDQRGWEWSFLKHRITDGRVLQLPGKVHWEYALTPDMSRAIFVDTDSVIRCLSLLDESLVWSQQAERLETSGSCVSPDGQQFLLAGSRKPTNVKEPDNNVEMGVIEAYSTANGKLLWTQTVTRAAFIPNYCRNGSQFLVTAGVSSNSSEVQLRSATDGQLIWSTPALTIASGIMNTAGTRVYISESASAQLQGAGRLRCLDAGDRSQKWSVEREVASAIILGHDDSEIMATGSELALVVYDAQNGQHKQTIPSSAKEQGLFVLGAAAGNYVVTAALNGRFTVWDGRNKVPLETNKSIAEGIDIRLSRDGNQLAFLNSKAVQLRPTRKPAEVLTLVGHKSGYKGARFLDQTRLCSVGTESAWRLWQTTTGQETFAAPLPAAGLELEIGPNADWFAAATMKGTQVCDVATGRVLQYWPQDGACWFAKRNQTGSHIVTAGEAGIARVYRASDVPATRQWTTKVDKPIREFKANNSIHGLAVSPDGNTIYTLDTPGAQLVEWDVTSGKRQVWRQGEPGQQGRLVELSPDGRYLAISVGATVEVWDLATKSLIKVLTGFQPRALALTFDQSSSRLLAGTMDGTVVLWSLVSFEQLLSFKAHESSIVCLAMSPDNSMLASTSTAGELKIWETKPLSVEMQAQRELVQKATDQANRMVLEHRTVKAAMQQLLSEDSVAKDLQPTILNILRARINAPINLNSLAAATDSWNKNQSADSKLSATQSPGPANATTVNLTAAQLKAKIDAALIGDMPELLQPTDKAPDAIESGQWNSRCRSLVSKSTFNLDPAQLIALLQQLEDNGERTHYLLYLKGIAHLQLSQWERAEAAISAAIAMVPAKSPLWFTYAFRLSFLQAYLGEWDKYQELCDAALNNFQSESDSVVLERLAKMCAFSNQGKFDRQVVSAIAERAVSQQGGLGPGVFLRLTRGICEMRQGRHEPALADFEFVLQSNAFGDQVGTDIMIALTRLYAAISAHHLGRSAEAERFLAEAKPAIDAFPTKSGWWPDWMMACVVRKEVEELLHGAANSAN